MKKHSYKLIILLFLSTLTGLVRAAPGDNLALSGSATMSSLWTQAWPASNCINGIRESNSNAQLCHTQRNSGTNEWFEIDLGVLRNIDVINIFNRNNCCQSRIRNMFVMVSDTPFTNPGNNAASLTSSRAAADFEFQIPNSTTGDIIVNANNVLGRYIRIQKSGINPGGPWINLLEVEVIESTVPVTLSSFNSRRNGEKLEINWGTSSELFNVGFQLWGFDGTDLKWEKLHGWLVRSGSGNSVESQSYIKTTSIPATISKLAAIGISSVDSDGSEHYYGPFDVGQSYGNLNTRIPIAWDHVRDQVDSQMRARGYVKDRVVGYRRIYPTSAAKSTDVQQVVEFRIDQAGVYRISSKSLSNAGIDWSAVEKREIAVINHHGESIVRYVSASGNGNGKSTSLGSNGDIYFYAPAIDNVSRLYSNSVSYRLVLDRHRALDAQFQGKRHIKTGFSKHHYTTEEVELDREYHLSSSGDDPWVDSVVLSYADQPRSYAAAITIQDDAMWDRDASLTLNLSSSSALPPVDANNDGIQDAEHIVQAVVLSASGNGELLPLGTAATVGRGIWHNKFKLPANTPLLFIDDKVVVGGMFSAGTGYPLSEVHVDSVLLTYARPYSAKAGDNHLMFTAPNDGALGYEVTVPQTGWPLVFAISNGNLVRLGLESQARNNSTPGKTERVVQFAALDSANTTPVNYWISGKGGMLDVKALSVKSIDSASALISKAAGADFLMIAHPAFIDTSLSQYAKFKQRMGNKVAIINYLDVVDTFGGGQSGPAGLTRYLNAVENKFNTLNHVLLVGGSSYDHTDKLGIGSMTFIPGHYGPSSYSKHTVTDAPYVSNSLNQLFASIGRWPVRNNIDLETIITNSMTWTTNDHAVDKALVIAEQTINGENIDFATALDDVSKHLPGKWTKSKVYVDEIAQINQLSLPEDLPEAITLAKNEIILQLNSNPNLVLYNGHATTSQLSNKGLFKASDVTQLNGSGTQMWIPMSCYMTYYESTHVNTLAYQLLFTGKAVGITGSMLLSNQAQNISTGKAIIQGTVNSGKTIGETVREHKTALPSSNLMINLAHLGDPTLSM